MKNSLEMEVCKPLFLLDNQKTVTRLQDLENNRAHRQAKGPSREETRIVNDVLESLAGGIRPLPDFDLRRIVHSIVDNVKVLDQALVKNKETGGPPPEGPQGWKITTEAIDLAKFVKHTLHCPIIILSGIVSEGGNNTDWDRSFLRQGFRQYLDAPYCLWRPASFDSSNLFKGTVHAICRILGVPTVGFDDDPNAVMDITNLGDAPACLVTRPEEEKYYKRGRDGLEYIDWRGGIILQLGVDGETLTELAKQAYTHWQNRGFQVSRPEYPCKI